MKIIKYSIVGSIAALTDFSLFYIFAKLLKYNYMVVAFISYAIATYINYILSTKFVFQSGTKYSKKVEISLIYLISGVAIGINQISLYLLIDVLFVEMLISKVIATAITFFWNYFLRKNFIFKENINKKKGKNIID